jgi:hypothetical protein
MNWMMFSARRRVEAIDIDRPSIVQVMTFEGVQITV